MGRKSIPVCMNLAAAATKHYGNMTGRYTWAGRREGCIIGSKGIKNRNTQTCLAPLK